MEPFNKKGIAPLCERYEVNFLGLFGSYARNEQKPSSDIDLLVRFSKPVGYFHLLALQDALEAEFGTAVDLVTEKGLSKYLRPYVLKDLKVLYDSKK